MCDAWRSLCTNTQDDRRPEKQEVRFLFNALLGTKQLAVAFFVTLCFGYVYSCRGLSVSDPHLPQLPENISFASELIKGRSELGLTQNQLSSKSGLSLSAIKAYETGRNMPGARELRELCNALQVSPNKLLFGKELPFESRSVLNALTESEAEIEMASRVHATILFFMLASDERKAIETLVRSLAIARHGVEEVKRTLLDTDLLTGITRGMMLATRDSLATGTDINPESLGSELEDFMNRQSHNPDPKKLLKK